MKVFVTGGNGFIGSRVVHRLHAHGHQVRCLLRKTSKTHRIDDVPYEKQLGDVRDKSSILSGLDGCDGIIHLASISSWEHIRSPIMRQVVIGGTRNVLDAAKEAGNLRTVFVSSATAINGTNEPVVMDESAEFTLDPNVYIYAGAKHEAEQMCHEAAAAGLPVVIVNPVETYGPNDDDFITASYLKDTLNDWPAMAVNGGTAVAHVDDIAGGIVAALEKGRPGERYILGGENLTARQIVDLTLEIGGQPNKFVLQLPNGLVKGLVKTLAALHLPTPVIPDLLDYACLYWFMDCSKAKEELGYTHRSAREALTDVINWLKEAGHVK